MSTPTSPTSPNLAVKEDVNSRSPLLNASLGEGAFGFDVVVGNPPYVQSRSEFIGEAQKSYFNKNYKTAQYQLNTYTLFVEKSFLLMKEKSILGFIIPNYYEGFKAVYFLTWQLSTLSSFMNCIPIFSKTFMEAMF